MVNEVRTLLLNLRPAASPYPAGEEYVPPDYQPATLPRLLLDARAALFGEEPSRTAINLNLARLLAYLHTSPFEADMTAADPRITYDPNQPSTDADPTVTEYNFVSAADGFSDADRLFRPDRSSSENAWLEAWLNASNPGAVRAGALALALAARTSDILLGLQD